MKIGVMGGMGPAASALFYRMTVEHTKARCDQEHMDMIILSHASMPDRTEALLAGRRAELLALLLTDARLLERCGADAVAIPCNTSHALADEIAAGINIPLINMPEDAARECADRFASRGGAKIAVLATDGTVRAGIYQRALKNHGLSPWLPSAETQELVMSLIYDGVKNGGEISRGDICVIERVALDAGCDAALMACTEMSVIRERFALSDFYIDALTTLVKSVIRFAGKEYI